ncbi:MAG: YbaY family lipoprotein [Pseudomonadota bacterium]
MRLSAVIVLSRTLAACGGGSGPSSAPAGSAPAVAAPQAPNTVTGMVLADSPVTLGPGAQVTVRLLDTTRADAEPTPVATATLPIAALPAEFALTYPADAIDSIRGYSVDAQVLDQGTVKFVSIGRVGVITQGKPRRVNVQLAQALTSATRDPAVELQRDFADFEARLGGLKRFADSRIVGPEGRETAIGWDAFADDGSVRMVRETVSDGEGNNRFTRRFAWKDGKLWVAVREQGGVSVRLGWDRDGALIVRQKNGQDDESVAAEAEALASAAKDAFEIASARAPR